MKIEYVASKRNYPKLREIPAGVVFTPTNSLEIYIKVDKDGQSDVFCDSYNILKRDTVDIQGMGDDFDDYTDIIAVVHLESGTLCFMNRETMVKPLECALEVEELKD